MRSSSIVLRARGCADRGRDNLELGYTCDEVNDVPVGSDMGLGCGNARAIASLQPGEAVLDLGSGGASNGAAAAEIV